MESKWKVYLYDFGMAIVMGVTASWMTLKLLSIM
jgi:hypothetical protein